MVGSENWKERKVEKASRKKEMGREGKEMKGEREGCPRGKEREQVQK